MANNKSNSFVGNEFDSKRDGAGYDLHLFVKITGGCTFLLLLIFALIFYKERAVTFDMAYQGFSIIINKKPVINLRVGASLPQIVPLLFRWTNCSLQTFLIISSTGLVIYYFTFFLFITFVLRQYTASIVFLLSGLLLVNDTFYWIQSELPQGLAWLILYYAYLQKTGPGAINYSPLLHFGVVLFLLSFHPLMVFPLFYTLSYLLYRYHKFNWPYYKWPCIITIAAFATRIVLSKFDSYESAKLDVVSKLQHHKVLLAHLSHTLLFPLTIVFFVFLLLIFFTYKRRQLWLIYWEIFMAFAAIIYGLIHFFHLASLTNAILFSGSVYSIYWLLLLVTIILLIKKRNFYPALLLEIVSMGYFLLICVMNRQAPKFYLENLMLPLGIFVLLPFSHLVIWGSHKFRKGAAPLLILIIICIRLGFIYNSHSAYSNRLFWYTNKFRDMDKMHTQRLMLVEKDVPMDTLIMAWASGYESVMLSSIDGPQYTKSIVIDTSLNSYYPYLHNDTLFLAKWDIQSANKLPSSYFILNQGRYITQ